MGNLFLKSKGTVAVLHFFLSEHIMSKFGSIISYTLHKGPEVYRVDNKKIRCGGLRKDPGHYTGTTVLNLLYFKIL